MPSVRHALLVALVPLFADAAQAAETARYVVLRNGQPVGSSLLRFERNGDRLDVTTDAWVRVAFGFMTLYEYRHVAREVWHGDQLVALDTETDDNGDRMVVSGRLTVHGFLIKSRDGIAIVPPNIRPTSFWREDTLAQPRLLDSETGRVVGITTVTLVDAKTAYGGQFQRYRIAGDLKHPLELTYVEGRLVSGRLRKLGADIEFRAEEVPLPQIAAGASGR